MSKKILIEQMIVHYSSKASKKRLAILVVRDIALIILVVGLFMLFRDLWEYYSNSLFITEEGVLMKKGFLTTETKEIPFENINTISISQGLLGKILNYGDLSVNTGGDKPEVVFLNLDNPQKFKQMVSQISNLNTV